MDIIKEVKINDLVMIGIDLLGHRIKIMKEIANLNKPKDDQPAAQFEGGTAYV